jgi:peptide/nickel transport system substrate-binding protein
MQSRPDGWSGPASGEDEYMKVRIASQGSAGQPRRLRRLLSGLFVLALIVSACGDGDDGDSGGEDVVDEDAEEGEDSGDDVDSGEGADEGAAGGGGKLTIGVTSLGTENFSPHQGTGGQERPVVYQVYERLIQTNPENREYVPGIAESWEPNDDFTQWTFRLRDDVKFHEGPDGQDYGFLTAEDVKFSMELAWRDDSRLGRASLYKRLLDDNLDNFEVIDDQTFVLNMSESYAIAPAIFSSTINTLATTSKAYWEEVGDEVASAHPVGTGPWKFESMESGTAAFLSAVEDHWRKAPEFDELEYRIIPDDAAQLAQLQTGDIDMATVPVDIIPEGTDLKIINVPNTGVSSLYLGGHFPGHPNHAPDSPWIQDDNPEQGRAIRQAMSAAIDRESIVSELMSGNGAPVVGPIHFVPGIPATNDEWVNDGEQVPEFDPERARELMAEGGYPDGFDVRMIAFEQSFPFGFDVSEAIASMLTDIGINVDFQVIQEAEYDEIREARGSEGIIWQYIQQPLADEPGDRFSAFLPADSGAEFFYQPPSAESDKSMEEWVQEMNSEPDFDARMDIAQELGQELIDYAGPAIGIAAVDAPWVVGPRISRWDNIFGLPEIHNVEYIYPAE